MTRILSYRHDCARAPDDVVEALLPAGGGYRAADVRRIAQRTDERLRRFMLAKDMPGMRAFVLQAGDGVRPQTRLELWRRGSWEWMLDGAVIYPIRLAQREQVRLVCTEDHLDEDGKLPWAMRRNGVLRPTDDMDLTAPPPRARGAKPEPEDTSYLDGFAL